MAVKKLCARRICSPGDTRHPGFGDASAREVVPSTTRLWHHSMFASYSLWMSETTKRRDGDVVLERFEEVLHAYRLGDHPSPTQR